MKTIIRVNDTCIDKRSLEITAHRLFFIISLTYDTSGLIYNFVALVEGNESSRIYQNINLISIIAN